MQKNQAFISFAECERKKLFISEQIEGLSRQIDEYKHKLDILEDQRQKARQYVADVQKKIHLIELELKSLESHVNEKKYRLLHTKNAKEYESLMKEIDVAHQKKVDLENSTFLLWDERDKAQQIQQFVFDETTKAKGILEEEIEQAREAKERKKSELIEQSEKSNEIMRLVDKTLLAEYKSMLEAVSNPAVPVESGSCSGCFYAVPRSDLMVVEKGEIITCKDCYRLIYLPSLPS